MKEGRREVWGLGEAGRIRATGLSGAKGAL